MSPEIVVTDNPDETPQAVILAGLIAYNGAQVGDADHRPLAVLATDGKGGMLDDYPPGHRRFFLRKDLA